jgi:predicted dehydrogenase
MTTQGLTAGILGLSWIGADPPGLASDSALGTAVPYSHASAYAATPGVTRIVGCDTSEQARRAFEEEWSSRFPELRTYSHVADMIEDARPDILSVVTPDNLHAQHVVDALMAGVPRVFCEKPLSISLEDADQVVEVAERLGATVSVNYTRRWIPEYVEARAQLRAGAIGELSQVIIQVGGPRAMLFRNLTHPIDLMSYFAEDDADWVIGELEEGVGEYREYRGDGHDPSLEPGANAYVKFRSGVRGYLAAQKNMPVGEAYHMVGTTGRITIDSDGLRIHTPSAQGTQTRRLIPQFTVAGMAAAVQEILRCHESGRAVSSSPREARRAVAIVQAILESHNAGQARITIGSPAQRGGK